MLVPFSGEAAQKQKKSDILYNTKSNKNDLEFKHFDTIILNTYLCTVGI
jgi:hypothetical protein